MSQDLVKALGVKVYEEVIYKGNGEYKKYKVVFVQDLESALGNLPLVYGCWQKSPNSAWFETEQSDSRATARLLAIEMIKREPVKMEFNAQVLPGINNLNACIKRSELIPLEGKFVKVTVEEIVGE